MTRSVTVIGKVCGFVIVTGTVADRSGARVPGTSPEIVNAPVGGEGGAGGGVAAGWTGLWMNQVVQDGRLGTPGGRTERTQKVWLPVPRPT